MTIPTYPEYKASEQGLEFEIPSHWTYTKARFAFDFGRGLTITKENLLDEGVPCVSYGEVHSKYGFEVNPETDKLRCVDDSYLKSSPYALLGKGDIVFADTSEDIDGAGNFTQLVSNSLVFAGYHTIIARPSQNHAKRFLAYLLDSQEFRSQIRLSVKGVKVFSVTQAILKSAALWLPPIYEQTQIARFLDHETAKIDALIAEQKRLIKLLQEKRQAVISHAVTKGLDPNVPMKDSGVEWLGEVPAHWGIRKVSYDFIAVKGPRGALLTKEYCATNQGPYPVYSGQTDNAGVLGSINDFDFSLGSNGGLLTTTVGAKAMSLNFVTNHISLSQNCMLIRPLSGQIFIKFYLYHLQPLFRLERGMIPDHMQPSFRMEDLYRFFVARPPVEEQKAIASYLDELVMKVDMLINEAGNSINLMQERRSALISAAVTGKIDVRDWQPPADESAFDEDVRKAGLETSA